MGVEWGERRIVIKPYRGTRTLRNLRATGAAVVNVTDDILLFSQAALGDPQSADPSCGEHRRRDPGRRLLVARGPRRGDRRPRAPRPRHRAGGRARRRTRVPGSQPSAPTRCSRRRSSRRARAGCRPTTSAPSCAGCRCSSTRPPARASARDGVRDAPCRCGDRRPVSAVRVEAPARLHLGMLAVAGDGARRFGGLGVAVDRPAVVLEAQPADELSAEGADAERALIFARRSHDALGLAGGAHLRVVEAIPQHVGLGSGTKLALAVAQALAALEGRDVDAPALTQAAGRAARSAVGMWTFALGGLVVEGGVRRGVDRPAPLLAHHPMPEDWRAVLVVPKAEPGLSGAAEEHAFQQLVPSPERSAAIAQLVLTSLLPALVERDRRGVRCSADPRPATGRRRVRRRAGRSLPSTRRRARRRAPARRGGRRRSELVGAGRLRRGGQRVGRARARGPDGARCSTAKDASSSSTFDNRGARVERS